MSLSKVAAQDVEQVLAAFPHLDRFEGRSVLITGCAGFLGYGFTHFFAEAMARGLRLRSLELLDNFLLGEPPWLAALARHDPRIHLRRFDVAKDRLETLQMTHPPEFIVHMASIASPTHYRRFPLETIDANVWGLRHLLDASRGTPVEGFLFFSSSEVYGDPPPEAIPTPEDYRGNVSSLGPRACYDEAKRFGETLCQVYAQQQGIPITIVRPFNNYGPGMGLHDRRAPADFARAVLAGEDIVLHSDGTPTRTYCYSADALVGYLLALTHGRFDVFNIGMERPELSMRAFAEMFAQAAAEQDDYRGRVVLRPSEEKDYLTHNPNRRCPDITKAREVLGFAPRMGVEAGVGRFLAHLLEGRAA